MTLWQRISRVLTALLIIAAAVLLLFLGEEGYMIVITILSFYLLIYTMRMLVFYFRMARYMVGGRQMLYRGILLFDLALFALSLSSVPTIYVMIYLIGMMIFSGVVDVMNAMSSKKLKGRWKLRMFRGVVSVFFGFLCLFTMNTPKMAVLIYSVSLIYNGIMRLISAFRPTAVIAIQ